MCLKVRSNTSCTRFKSVTSSFNNSSLSLTLLTAKSACEEVLGTLLYVVFLTSGCRNVGAFRFFGDSSFHLNFEGILPSYTNILPFKDFFKSSGLK